MAWVMHGMATATGQPFVIGMWPYVFHEEKGGLLFGSTSVFPRQRHQVTFIACELEIQRQYYYLVVLAAGRIHVSGASLASGHVHVARELEHRLLGLNSSPRTLAA